MYDKNLFIVVFFGITWLGTVGMSGTFSRTFRAEHIGPTRYCRENVQGHLLMPAAIVILFNDMLVYVALTWKVYHTFADSEASVGQRIRHWIFGMQLPVWSRAVFQDSQLYCLVIVLTNAFWFIPAANMKPPTSTMLIICHLVPTNILSSRLYRIVRAKLEAWEARNATTNFEFGSRRHHGAGGHTSHFEGDAAYGVMSSGTIHYRERELPAASIKSASTSGKSDFALELQSHLSDSASVRERENMAVGSVEEKQQAAIYVVSRDEPF